MPVAHTGSILTSHSYLQPLAALSAHQIPTQKFDISLPSITYTLYSCFSSTHLILLCNFWDVMVFPCVVCTDVGGGLFHTGILPIMTTRNPTANWKCSLQITCIKIIQYPALAALTLFPVCLAIVWFIFFGQWLIIFCYILLFPDTTLAQYNWSPQTLCSLYLVFVWVNLFGW